RRGRSVPYAKRLMVAFRTSPPSRSGNGATSVPPPANETRKGALARINISHPVDGLPNSFSDPYSGLEAQHITGLGHVRPAPHHVDLEGRQVLELERVRVLTAFFPDHASDFGDGHLFPCRDVEVLVRRGRVTGGDDDPLGDVVDVRDR